MKRLVGFTLALLPTFLSSATEARSCKHTVCRAMAIVCLSPSCGRDAVGATIPHEEGLVQMMANHQPPLAYFLDENYRPISIYPKFRMVRKKSRLPGCARSTFQSG